MIAHGDELYDAIALLALGTLPQAEATALAAHVRDCAYCRRTYAELRGAADAVGYAAELAPGELDDVTAARLKSRVMNAVRRPAVPPERPAPWLAYVAAAAALLLAALAGFDDLALRSASGRDAARIAALQERADAEAGRVAQLVAPGSKHFEVPGGEVVTSGGRVLIAMRHMPPPPPGRVYQAWTLARGAKGVAPSVTFVPDASGLVLIELPEGAAGLAAVAVSLEPAGGSKAPTSPPAFVRKLS